MKNHSYIIMFFSILLLVILSTGNLTAQNNIKDTENIVTTEAITSEDDSFEESDEDMDSFLEDDDDSFEELNTFPSDQNIDELTLDMGNSESNDYSLSGYLKEELAYSHAKEDPYFSKVRSVLNLNFDYKHSEKTQVKLIWNGFYDDAYRIEGRDEFTDKTLEMYESESEIRDFYLNSTLSDWFQIKLGRQIIAWGQSDSFQVIDLVNPRDQRELAQTDIEDTRIPVAASKFSFFKSSWTLDMVWVHENRVNKTGQIGSDFDPFINLRTAGLVVEQDDAPENKLENSEYFIRIFKAGEGYDFSFIVADMFDDDIHFSAEIKNKNTVPYTQLTPEHQKVKVLGLAANILSGAWIWKTESSYTYKKALSRNDLQQQIQKHMLNPASDIVTKNDKDVIKLMIGIEYSGFDDLLLIYEVMDNYIKDHNSTLLNEERETTQSFRFDYSMLNDQFSWQGFLHHLSDQNGMIMRTNISYDISDGWNIEAGVIDYMAEKEENTLYPYRNQDRIFSSVKVSF